MKATHALLLAACAVLGLGPQIPAQTLAGHVRQRGVGVEGAVVLLLGADDSVRARAIAHEDGRYVVTAPSAGRYRVRVLRIGLAPTVAGPYDLQPAATTRAEILLTGEAVLLDRVTVSDRARCGGAPDSLLAAFRVWDGARTALLAASVTRTEPFVVSVTHADRTLDRDGSHVVSERSSKETGPSVTPFVSLPPDSVLRRGYVVRSVDATTYWGPDVDVLASESFSAAHCFRVGAPASGESSALVGVTFTPVGRPRDLVEIEGVVWVDRGSGELRAVDYRYVNAPLAEKAKAGGRIEFLRLPAGSWIVQQWTIRYPIIAIRSGEPNAPVVPGMARTTRSAEELAGVRLTSGEVAEVRRGGTVLWERGRVTLRVHVVDSLTGAPRAGVLVGEAASGSALASGDDGTVRIPRVVPGLITLRVRIPELEPFGEDVRDVVASVRRAPEDSALVVVPTASDVLAASCGARTLAWGEGLVRGRLPAAMGTRTALVQWSTPYARLGGGEPVLVTESRRVTVDSSRTFTLCGVPRDAVVTIESAEPDEHATLATLRFATGALAVRWGW